MKIFKQTLEIVTKQILELPHDSKILTIQTQQTSDGEKVQVWYLCEPDPSLRKTPVVIWIVGTGEYFSFPPSKYLSTVQLNKGTLVLHVFAEFPK